MPLDLEEWPAAPSNWLPSAVARPCLPACLLACLSSLIPPGLPGCYAAIKFASYLFRFQPKRCYLPKTRPCKALNKTYLRIDPAPRPWPPTVLAPGEYTTHVIGVVKNGHRVHILTQLLGVGRK